MEKFEYFDSFGLPIRHAEIANFFEKHSSKPYTYNNQILQDFLSRVCGLYAIYTTVLCQFSSAKKWLNDRLVYDFVRPLL